MSSPVATLVIHGGAWAIPDEEVVAHIHGMDAAMARGRDVLEDGGSALDAVETAIQVMEDDPTFDAGKGSVLNTDGSVEMDASIQDGESRRAGAVAALRNFPNPIAIARRIMENTPHILLAGQGAEAFARIEGFKQVPVTALLTERELIRLEKLVQDKDFEIPDAFGRKRGTVGAVAIDNEGRLAAGTSTGGTPKKIPGRVGDSALIGAGTLAEGDVGGVSCTGWGEAIIQVGLARVVVEAMRQGQSADQAAVTGIELLSARARGLGGVIVLDKDGHIGIHYNTPRMARGYWHAGMANHVATV